MVAQTYNFSIGETEAEWKLQASLGFIVRPRLSKDTKQANSMLCRITHPYGMQRGHSSVLSACHTLYRQDLSLGVDQGWLFLKWDLLLNNMSLNSLPEVSLSPSVRLHDAFPQRTQGLYVFHSPQHQACSSLYAKYQTWCPLFSDAVYSAELKLLVKQAWCLTAVIPAPGRLKKEDCCEFKSPTKMWGFVSKNKF